MATTGVQIEGIDKVNELINNLPPIAFDNAKKVLQQGVIDIQDAVVGGSFNSSSSALTTDKLTSRTGLLRKSIKTSVSGTDLSNLSAKVYTDSVYAPIHENGGMIVAKDKYLGVPGGPYLNIPLDANKTAAGVMRYSASQVFAMGGFIFQSKLGNWIVGITNKNKVSTVINADGTKKTSYGIDAMFVLKKSVYIRPRLKMVENTEAAIPGIMDRLGSDLLEGLQ